MSLKYGLVLISVFGGIVICQNTTLFYYCPTQNDMVNGSIYFLVTGAKGASALPIALTSLSSSSEETASDSPDDEENSSIEKFFLTPSNQLKALTGSPSDAKDQLTVDHLLADAFEDLGGVSLSTYAIYIHFHSLVYPLFNHFTSSSVVRLLNVY